jgi:hypothetical protein
MHNLTWRTKSFQKTLSKNYNNVLQMLFSHGFDFSRDLDPNKYERGVINYLSTYIFADSFSEIKLCCWLTISDSPQSIY